jgi:hypothetical protein
MNQILYQDTPETPKVGFNIPGGLSPLETIEGLAPYFKSYKTVKTCQQINSIIGKSYTNFHTIMNHDPKEYLSLSDFSETTRRYR